MAGRAAIMLALGIPVAAGLLYLVLGSAPLAYPLANALALLIAVPIAAFAPLRLAEREQRVLTLVLLALLFVPLVSGPHLGTVARWLPLGPVNLHTGALALPALVVLAARDEDYAPPILLAALGLGLVIGLIQAATSVNEQTLTFVPKLGAVAFVLVILGASMMALVGDFTQDVFTEIARIGD